MKNTFNPRLIGAFYFAVFAVFFNLIAKYFLFVFQAGDLLPFFSSTLIFLLLSALFGSLFSKRIIEASKPGHAFGWGMLLALVIIPFYSLGLQLIFYIQTPAMYSNIHLWQDYVVLYGVITLFVFLIAGIWLIPLTGGAALLFNRRIMPGYTAYLNKVRKGLSDSENDNE
jgi:hypothetical protein